MTTKQLSKLTTRIATLKAAGRIVWIEGIDAKIIKGTIAGKKRYFVKAESLNADGGCWYYIVRWEQVEWICGCESVKPCKHEKALQARINALVIAQRQPTHEEHLAEDRAYRHEQIRKAMESRVPRVLSEAEETAAAYYRMSLQEF